MRSYKFILSALACCLTSWVGLMADDFKEPESESDMTLTEDSTYVVNTTNLCPTVYGFNWTTPLLVYIRNDRITKIVSLANQETPNLYERAEDALFPKMKKISLAIDAQKRASIKKQMEAANQQEDPKPHKKVEKPSVKEIRELDAITGASYSCEAIKENVEAAILYYWINQ